MLSEVVSIIAPTSEMSCQVTGIPNQRSFEPQRPGPISTYLRFSYNMLAFICLISRAILIV